MVLHAAELDEEVVDAAINTVSVDQSCNDHGMVGGAAQRAGPKFGAGDGRRVDHPAPTRLAALGFGQEGGRRLQRAHVASMPEFRLRVATDHLPITNERQPFGLLLIIAQGHDVGNEHHPVQGGWQILPQCLQQDRKVLAHDDLTVAFVADSELAAHLDKPHVLGHGTDVTFRAVQVVDVIVAEDAGRIGGDHFLQESSPFRLVLATVQHVGDALHVERGALSFSFQIGVHPCCLLRDAGIVIVTVGMMDDG
mmetsp:Transcript_1427/g.3518  ORF Transcript_1427/g.3518 Transcript_1427/m.3518 type:complete len:252 (-) Transcript_1427:56-811(-)